MAGVVEAQNRQARPGPLPQPRGPPPTARSREPIDREKVHLFHFIVISFPLFFTL